MKYILILLISCFFVSSAYAAKQVPGNVPVVQPLQPPAAGVAPNYSKNIQYADPARQQAAQQAVVLPQTAPIQKELIQQKHNSYPWAFVITLLLGTGALFIVWKNTRKP